jgi:Na+/melibiose symporter-like transporter
MPESKSTKQSKFDGIGVLTSSIGLVALTYGVIKAGEKSWSDSGVISCLCLGVIALVGFVVWQRYTKNPLIDLSLFRSARFTWGSILATFVSFAMFGLLFAMPQYFQAVGGADTLGTGLRLLPLIGGLIVGAKFADKLGIRLGAKYVVAIGFGLIALGLFIGTTTKVESHYSFAALWITITGMGLGLALPTAMDAALGELSAERSGVGSALIMALRQVGGTIGVAILGSALNSNYRNHLDITGLPEAVSSTIKHSVAAGVAVAKQLHSIKLVESIRSAFVNGMELMLIICGSIALLGILLALLFLPRKKSNGQEKGTQLESLSIDK